MSDEHLPAVGPATPFGIGSPVWPGLAKATEESGELGQVIGKLMAFPGGWHPDENDENLVTRLEKEIADVMAACQYIVRANGLDISFITGRAESKYRRFRRWHQELTGRWLP